MDAVVVAPREPGGYLVGWDVVHEGVLWVSRVAGGEPSRFGVTVAATHAATLRAESPWLVVVGVVVWIGGSRSCAAGSVVPQATPTTPSTATVAAISVRSGRLMASDARPPTPPTARARPAAAYCRVP